MSVERGWIHWTRPLMCVTTFQPKISPRQKWQLLVWRRGSCAFQGCCVELSSCLWHLCELHDDMLLTRIGNKSVTDGWTDHRTTFLSVQLSLITSFLNLNLDLHIAAWTAPYQSWRNSVECNTELRISEHWWSQMRDEAEHKLQQYCTDGSHTKVTNKSLEPTITLLGSIAQCLKLKWRKFQVSAEIIFRFLPLIPLWRHHKGHQGLKSFVDHWCIARRSFKNDCKPVRTFQTPWWVMMITIRNLTTWRHLKRIVLHFRMQRVKLFHLPLPLDTYRMSMSGSVWRVVPQESWRYQSS